MNFKASGTLTDVGFSAWSSVKILLKHTLRCSTEATDGAKRLQEPKEKLLL